MFSYKKSLVSRKNASQRGGVFFFITLGIVLFAALSYAVIHSSENTTADILDDNNAKLSQGEIDAYYADIRAGITQLQLDGCQSIDYTTPADQGTGDKSCFLFHPDGGGVAYRDLGLGIGCNLTSMAIGEVCYGVVYAGISGGSRIYTTQNDLGVYSYNNGTGSYVTTGATSTSNGKTNTDTLAAASDAGVPYKAAVACRTLGSEWYLPAKDEVSLLYDNRALIGNFNSVPGSTSTYVSSTETSQTEYFVHNFSADLRTNITKDNIKTVRCVRRD